MPATENIFVSFWNTIKQYILYPLSDIRFIDVIDILILALLFFAFYHFIKQRRAGKLIIGLALIIGFMVLSIILDMHAIKFVIQNFYQVGILAVIIIFQPELRAALEKVGNTSLTGIRSIGMNDDKDIAAINAGIDAICEAVCDMSLYKTGALIVIERSVKLGEYIKPSNVVEAKLSSRMIQSIFYDKAPFHDGAVIVRDMHIFAAGCVLPLTTSENLESELGTRHRASIGITEVSDAIAIVVSEETGVISIAQEGIITRNYNYNLLKNELTHLLIHNKSKENQDNGDNSSADKGEN